MEDAVVGRPWDSRTEAAWPGGAAAIETAVRPATAARTVSTDLSESSVRLAGRTRDMGAPRPVGGHRHIEQGGAIALVESALSARVTGSTRPVKDSVPTRSRTTPVRKLDKVPQ
ncbi:hypothetical protein Airi02_036300 [Actinoallomurus iriomotensis]|uniref:Uncharacterized protein n=1 Tax=Actinoallomurus iriomotensis TaxID=478107 RepID=A0A9W6W183_9ACTN|nr:hypothetical protein Airi02_036300 [Actinoallomurus iriomotensis]